MGTEQQTFTGDASQLVAEYDKLEARARKLEEAQKKGAKTASDGNKQLAKEMKDLQREAEATTKSVMTPTEKYQAQLAKLNQQRAAGAISEETYARAVQKTQQELLGAGRAQQGVFSTGLDNVAKMATGWLSVTAAINAASAAHREKLRIERESSDKQLGLASATENLQKNLYGANLTGSQQQAFLGELGEIQNRTGFANRAQLYEAAASGISASAGNVAATSNAVEAAARITRFNPDQLQTFSGGALDIGKTSGSEDARGNLGFLLSSGSFSRVVDPRKQAQNIAPAVGSIVGTLNDADRERATIEAGALFAAFSDVGFDEKGERSRTSSIRFSEQLRDFFREGVTEGSGKKKQTFKPGFDPGTLSGRIELLQQNRELGEKFLANAPQESGFNVVAENLIRGGNTSEAFNKARRGINFDVSAFEALAGNLQTGTSESRLASANAALTGNIEGSQIEDDLAGRTSLIRQKYIETLERTAPGYSGYATRLYSARAFDAALASDPNSPEQVAIAAYGMENTRIAQGNILPGQFGNIRQERDLTPQERKAQELTLEQIAVMQELVNATKAATENNNHGAALAERKTHLEN